MHPYLLQPLLESQAVETAEWQQLHTILHSAELIFDRLQPSIRVHEVQERSARNGQAVVEVECAVDWLTEDRQGNPYFSLPLEPEGEEVVLSLYCYYVEIAESVGMAAEECESWGLWDSIRDRVNFYPVNLVAFAKFTAHENNYILL